MVDKMVDQIRTMGLNNKIEWYPVISPEWTGELRFYEVDKVFFHGKSEYQELLVFQSAKHGKVAILDGQIQLTEKDEFVYQEMLKHLPLCSIPNPKKVYKQFFPETAVGYEDLRVNVYINDGICFLLSCERLFNLTKAVPEGTYDVIILDAFECMGATAIELANKEFLESVAWALRPGGVMSTPTDNFWQDNFVLEDTITECRPIFKGSVRYAWRTIPSYSSGTIGFVLCSTDGPAVNFQKPVNPLDTQNNGVAKGPSKFYDSQIHAAAFWLPSFGKKGDCTKF